MPVYEFACEKCGEVVEKLRPMKDSGKAEKCPECGTKMVKCYNPPARFGQTWDKPILDESVGVNANQVAEHRRMYPDIPLTNDGRVIVKSMPERNRIRNRLNDILTKEA